MNIYLDNAASSPLDPEVFDHMAPVLRDFTGNPSSTHSFGRKLKAELEQSRRIIAGLLNVKPTEICFTSGGTEANNMILRGAVDGLGVKHIVSSQTEHHAVSNTIEVLEQKGLVKARWLSVDGKGYINLDELREILETHSDCLVSIMHGNNEIGTLQDVKAIADLCQEYGSYFHSDTVQTIGMQRYDLQELKVDFLTASAHKFNGPNGIGFLYMRKGLKVPSLLTGGKHENGMRAGTENVAGISGMAFAYQLTMDKLEKKVAYCRELKAYMQEKLLEEIPGVRFNGEIREGVSLPHVLNVTFPCGEIDAMLLFNLDIAGIAASGGSACSSGAVKGSHVLAGIGVLPHQAINSVRFSFGTENTRDEIDFTLNKIKEILAMMQPA